MFDNKNSKYKSPFSFNRNNNSGLKKINNSFFETKFSPVILLAILVLAISLLTRIVLLIKTGKNFDLSFKNITGSFALGTFFDLAMASYLIVPFVLLIWFTSDRIYSKT